jgi:ribonuclease D
MRTKWDFEKLKKEALKHKSRWEFQQKNPAAYAATLRRKDREELFFHMGPNKRKPYSKQELISIALKYKTRNEFAKNNESAHKATLKRSDCDEICSHMLPSLTEAYSLEELKVEAKKYNSRKSFQNESPNIYRAALRHPDYEEMCSHMKNTVGSSIAERELFSIIKSIYPQTKKLMDKKVKIEGKPYIYGFEIDILVGNLGIEFDGTYWHSFNKLKERLPNWSDEDVQNYPEIKDTWFATKGIKILHIKEKDWNENKQACIDKCLEFLGN